MKLKINQSVSWRRKGVIVHGNIARLYRGEIIGSANKHPGLRRQFLADVVLSTGETITIDQGYLDKKHSGI